MRLQDDGLIVKSSGQGFRVAPLKEEECRHLMEVRLAVEGQAAMRAAERITDEQLRKLDELSEEYRKACSVWDKDAIRLGFSDTAQKQIERDIYGMTDIFGSW